jgi:hypothetical protein
MKLRAHEGNTIPYFQDFSVYKGIPVNIIFNEGDFLMEKITIKAVKVNSYKVFPTCTLCGNALKNNDNLILCTDPPQKSFKCPCCGWKLNLYEKDWPHIEYREEENA